MSFQINNLLQPYISPTTSPTVSPNVSPVKEQQSPGKKQLNPSKLALNKLRKTSNDQSPTSLTSGKKRSFSLKDLHNIGKARRSMTFDDPAYANREKPISETPTTTQPIFTHLVLQMEKKSELPYRLYNNKLKFYGEDITNGNEVLLKGNGHKSSLKLLSSKGVFHDVWVIDEKDPKIVIKTIKSTVGVLGKKNSIKDTNIAYEILLKRELEEKDIQVARMYNKYSKDGFYVYEFVSGDEPTFDEVKEILKKMIVMPSTFIADFKPENLKMRDGKVVIIDPSIDDKEEIPLHLTHIFKRWVLNADETVNKDQLSKIISEFDQTLSENELWQTIVNNLREKYLS